MHTHKNAIYTKFLNQFFKLHSKISPAHRVTRHQDWILNVSFVLLYTSAGLGGAIRFLLNQASRL